MRLITTIHVLQRLGTGEALRGDGLALSTRVPKHVLEQKGTGTGG